MPHESNLSNDKAADGSSVDAAESAIRREAGEVDPKVTARVKEICEKSRNAEKFWEKSFKRIKEDVKFAANLNGAQWEGDANKYVANLVLRHIQERTASLYAKNPRVRAKRKERLDFAIWDEKPETLTAAIVNAQTALAQGQVPDQQVVALVEDVTAGKQQRDMVDRIGRTMMVLYHHFLDEPQPRFKTMMKAGVKRTITCGIGWVKLSYQRAFDTDPEVIERINDVTAQIARIETLAADFGDEIFEDDSARLEELTQSLKALQAQDDILVDEGLVHTFPEIQHIILDPQTRRISGFVGTRWMAHKYVLTVDQIKETYKIDVSRRFTAFHQTREGEVLSADQIGQMQKEQESGNSLGVVYEYFDKVSGVVSVVCEGYPDYLRAPAPPKVRIKRFFPFFSIMFNEIENSEGEVYPPSDVRLLSHQQREHNRSREALRQHRIANQPFYIDVSGSLDDEDKEKLSDRIPHEILSFISSFPPGTDLKSIIGAMPSTPIDPNLYETGSIFEDIQRAVGSQEATFGSTSGDTATETSIAEGSRIQTLSSATDDLEETLTELARAGGETLLLELDPESAKKIAGPGAVWPALSRQEFADQVFLEIVAGSNGRPNRSQEIANLERLAPVIVQTPGFNPTWLARKVAEALDDGVDLTEALLDGMPSILAMNAAAKAAAKPGKQATGSSPNTENPDGIPEDQGDAGGDNAERPNIPAPGGQPAFPATA